MRKTTRSPGRFNIGDGEGYSKQQRTVATAYSGLYIKNCSRPIFESESVVCEGTKNCLLVL